MEDNLIHIYYEILNSTPGEKYIIRIEISDENGNPINAKTLNGDIGAIEDGEGNKHITWNLEADNIYIEAYVSVQINAKIIPPSAATIAAPIEEQPSEEVRDVYNNLPVTKTDDLKEKINQEDLTQDKITEETTPPIITSTSFNRTGIILQSLALPGLGLSRITGKPHWLRGVAGYACIVGSVVLHRQAINTFDGIEDLVYFDEINEAYDKALLQDNISDILPYIAIGIWITDIIWTVVGTSDLNSSTMQSRSRGISFSSKIDPISNTPLIGVRYGF